MPMALREPLLLLCLLLQEGHAFAAASSNPGFNAAISRKSSAVPFTRSNSLPKTLTAGNHATRLSRFHSSSSFATSSTSSSTALHLSLRGGAASTTVTSLLTTASSLTSTPQALFNSSLVALGVLIVLLKLLGRDANASVEPKPENVSSLQRRFLSVFWLLRMSE